MALSPEPAPYRHFVSLGRELPDFSGRQEVHHRLVALFYGKQLRDLRIALGSMLTVPSPYLIPNAILNATLGFQAPKLPTKAL